MHYSHFIDKEPEIQQIWFICLILTQLENQRISHQTWAYLPRLIQSFSLQYKLFSGLFLQKKKYCEYVCFSLFFVQLKPVTDNLISIYG